MVLGIVLYDVAFYGRQVESSFQCHEFKKPILFKYRFFSSVENELSRFGVAALDVSGLGASALQRGFLWKISRATPSAPSHYLLKSKKADTF